MAAEKEIAIYFDASRCSACKGCQINCKQWNQLPSPYKTTDEFSGSFENPLKNNGDTWLHMRFQEGETAEGNTYWAFGREACQHCTNAACVEVCPTGACHHTPNGSVVIDKDTCIGCEYCVAACPFDIPHYNERENIQATRKCWLCQDRITNDREPACVSTCPTDALQFGERSEMLAKAKARLEVLKETRPNAIVYGEHEMGGLHVIQVLPYGAKAVRLPENPRYKSFTLASKYMKPIAGIGALGVAALATVAFIGGRGSERAVDEIQFDPSTGVTTVKGVPVDDEGHPVTKGGSND